MPAFDEKVVSPHPWQTIQDLEFVSVPSCWETCGGGRCCSNNHPDLAFRLLPKNGTTLLYLKREYAFLSERGEVAEKRLGGPQPQRLELDFGGPVPITILQTYCGLLGKCAGVVAKPLLCKLYPFLPVMDIDGKVKDLAPASVFDVTADELGINLPCGVRETKADILSYWRGEPNILGVFGDPYVLFHLMAGMAFCEVYRERLRSNSRLSGLVGRDFWQTWEIEYLGGHLVDVAEFRRRVSLLYQEISTRHGAFLE